MMADAGAGRRARGPRPADGGAPRFPCDGFLDHPGADAPDDLPLRAPELPPGCSRSIPSSATPGRPRPARGGRLGQQAARLGVDGGSFHGLERPEPEARGDARPDRESSAAPRRTTCPSWSSRSPWEAAKPEAIAFQGDGAYRAGGRRRHRQDRLPRPGADGGLVGGDADPAGLLRRAAYGEPGDAPAWPRRPCGRRGDGDRAQRLAAAADVTRYLMRRLYEILHG